MQLTVGALEEMLRKYNKDTVIFVGCNSCNHGSSGSESIVKINENLNQTYGYIEIVVNNKVVSKVSLSPDEKEFYEKEVEKLNKKIALLASIVAIYEDELESIENTTGRIQRRISYIKE